MSKLYLVGTIHLDAKGPERLNRLLEYVRPAHICVEFPEDKKDMVSSLRTALKTISAIQAPADSNQHSSLLDKILSVPGFEIFSSLAYQDSNPDVKVHYIDSSPSIVEAAQMVEFPMTALMAGMMEMKQTGFMPLDIMRMLEGRLGDGAYDNTDSIENQEQRTPGWKRTMRLRDLHMAQNIRSVFCQPASHEDMVAVVGVAHLYGARDKTLYDLLKDLNPMRMKLRDVDSFRFA